MEVEEAATRAFMLGSSAIVQIYSHNQVITDPESYLAALERASFKFADWSEIERERLSQ